MPPDNPSETLAPDDMEDIWEQFAERAAILQYDAGMSMQEAETLALEAVICRRYPPNPPLGKAK